MCDRYLVVLTGLENNKPFFHPQINNERKRAVLFTSSAETTFACSPAD